MTDLLTLLSEMGDGLVAKRNLIASLKPSARRDQIMRDSERIISEFKDFLLRFLDYMDHLSSPPPPRAEIEAWVNSEIKPILMALTQAELFLSVAGRK